jgi:hypothetical protein
VFLCGTVVCGSNQNCINNKCQDSLNVSPFSSAISTVKTVVPTSSTSTQQNNTVQNPAPASTQTTTITTITTQPAVTKTTTASTT